MFVEREAGLGAGHAFSLHAGRRLETYLTDVCCQFEAFAVGAAVSEPTRRPQAAAKQRMAVTLNQDHRLPFI